MPVLHQFFHLPFSDVLPVLSTNAYWVISSSIFFILYHRKYDKYHWAGNANLRFSYVVILRETRSNYLKLIYFPKWNFIYSTKGKQIWKVIISLLTTHWGTRRPKRPDMCFCDPMDYSPPGSSVHGISQAKILVVCYFLFQGIEPGSPAL